MKRRPFIIFILIITVFTVFMTGCKKKIEDKITEKIVEKTTGAQVDIDKGTTTIKTGEGTTQTGQNLKWPKDKMGNLPELKANINTVLENKEKTIGMIYFDGLKKDDAIKYVNSIKKLNYKSLLETTSSDGFMYSGKDEDGSEVVFSYLNDGTGSISYTDKPFMFQDNPNNSDSTKKTSGSENIDMTDAVPWPKDFFKNIPELEGKITEVSSSSPQAKFIYIEYVIKEDALNYIEKLKKIGFTESPSESMSGDSLNYEASNENEDHIIFSWSNTGYATINILKAE